MLSNFRCLQSCSKSLLLLTKLVFKEQKYINKLYGVDAVVFVKLLNGNFKKQFGCVNRGVVRFGSMHIVMI